MGGIQLGCPCRVVGADLLGVAIGTDPLIGLADVQEGGAHGCDLFRRLGAHVSRPHDGSQRVRGADGGESCDTGANHEHGGGGHLACRGHLTGKEAPESMGRFDDGPVTGDVRQGAESVKGLGTRGTRHHVHTQRVDALGRNPPGQARVLPRRQEGDQCGSRTHVQQLCIRRRPDREHDVTIPGVVDDHSANFAVRIVVE